ncbi:MAG: hypothetical protein A3F41_03390 [Coxiella sp. RIFCSPHIGHO2_12_FULL_44_14]|nr:MAG: hypothetical protein A3F41_03390 [Coxiella sp. RIFCSPHIGHO2_12_FULL_44_14]
MTGESSSDIEIVTNTPSHVVAPRAVISYGEAIKLILSLGIPMALSFTFSFSILLIGLMTSRLQQEDESQDYLGAATLITTMAQVLTILMFSHLFAMGGVASEKRGRLTEIEKQLNDLTVRKCFLEAERSLKPIGDSDGPELAEIQSLEASIVTLQQKGISPLKQSTSTILKNGWILSIVPMLAAMAAMFFSKSILIRCFGQRVNVATPTQLYLRWYTLALPPLALRFCVEQMIFAFKNNTAAMLMGLSTLGVGTFLAGYLGFGPLHWGLLGIALGYVAEAFLTCLSFCLYLKWHKDFRDFPFFRSLTTWSWNDLKQMTELLRVGGVVTFEQVNTLATQLTMSLFAGQLSRDELDTYNMGAQLGWFTWIPSLALALTLWQEISRRMGEALEKIRQQKGDGQLYYRDAQRIAQVGLPTSTMLVSGLCLPFIVRPNFLTAIVNNNVNSHVRHMANTVTPVMAGTIICNAALITMVLSLRGGGDLYVPVGISVANLWLGVLLAYMLGFKTNFGIDGIVIGYGIGIVLGTLFVFRRFISHMKPEKLAAANGEPTITVNERTALLTNDPPYLSDKRIQSRL